MQSYKKKNLTYLWKNEEFKNVYEYADSDKGGQIVYEARISINKREYAKVFDEPRDAAKHVDIILLQHGKDPVNILKKKGGS